MEDSQSLRQWRVQENFRQIPNQTLPRVSTSYEAEAHWGDSERLITRMGKAQARVPTSSRVFSLEKQIAVHDLTRGTYLQALSEWKERRETRERVPHSLGN